MWKEKNYKKEQFVKKAIKLPASRRAGARVALKAISEEVQSTEPKFRS